MKPALYLIAAAGSGKTYAAGGTLARLLEDGWHKKNTISPWPIIYVTKASVVTQTKRVLEKEFGIDTLSEVTCVAIDQLRSRFGQMFVKETMKIVEGEEVYTYNWAPMINPKLIVWDEAHALKNHTSAQHKIALSYSKLPGVHQIFMSATPATRVSEFKCFVCACKIHYDVPGLGNVLINEHTWNDFAAMICRGAASEQYEYNQAACDRLTDIMEPFIVRMKGIKPQFRARNKVEVVPFVTQEGRDYYKSAEDRYAKRKAKAEGRIADGVGSALELLVALQQYNIAAESNPDRGKIIVDRMIADVRAGFASVCAMKYKISISKILKVMLDEYKIPRHQISVIWGGASQQMSKKAAAKKAITGNAELEALLGAQGITLEGIGLDVDVIEEIKFAPDLGLSGTQTQEQRQDEIDRFQKGISKFCFFTMKSGGVGLSLHHSDALIPENLKKKAFVELDNRCKEQKNKYVCEIVESLKKKDQEKAIKLWHVAGGMLDETDRRDLVLLLKCRRKESGYVYEEDIPFVPIRPRKLYAPPCYSAIDFVQTLGRCPRLTSLSDTEQIIIHMKGTIEESVAFICNNKLRCMSKVIRMHEDWNDVLEKDLAYAEKLRQQSEKEAQENPDNPDELIDPNMDESEDSE